MKKIWLGVATALSLGAIIAGTTAAVAENLTAQDTQANVSGITQLLKNDRDCTFTAGVDSPAEADKACSGVEVYASSSKAKFSYNGVVNLKEKENFIGFLFTPIQMGSSETSCMTITLTDVYDADKFITIAIRSGANVGYPSVGYLKFNHSNVFSEDGFGMEYTNCLGIPEYEADIASGKIKKDFGGDYYLYYPTGAPDYAYEIHKWGSKLAASLQGKMGSNDRYTPSYLYYDPDDLAIYGNSRYSNWPDRYEKLFDFDNPYIVGTESFSGFTTNEVYISVEVEATAAGSHLLLTEFGGVDMSLSDVPTCTPVIGVDFGAYEENALPYGIAGENSSYPIFDSFAYTTQDGKFDVDEIYVLRGTSYIPVVNGRFATKESGVYRIIYKANSESGYTATRQVEVVVKADYEFPVDYAISDDIPSEVYIGTGKVYLPDGVVSGGSGELSVEKVLTTGEQEISIEQDGNLSYFQPTLIDGQTTVYTLTYKVTSINGITYEFDKEITVKASEKPVLEKVYVPKAVRVGYPTEFAVPSAVYYNGSEEVDVPVVLRIDGKIVENGVYTPTQAGDFLLEYIAYNPNAPTDETKAYIEQYTVTALELLQVGKGVLFSSYFVTDNFVLSEATSSCLTYKVSSVGKSTIQYANALSASVFSVDTNVNGNNYFKSVKFLVQDSKDATLKVEFELRNVTGLSVLYVNGVRQSQTSGAFNSTNNSNRLSLRFSNYDFTIKDVMNDVVGKVEYDMSGRKFNGFTSGTVYLTIETESVSEQAALSLYAINNQAFTNANEDRRAPDITFEKDMPLAMYVAPGDQIVAPAAKAYDVFSGVRSLSVTITMGVETIYTGDASEDYAFTATDYGVYIIAYKAVDTNGRSLTRKISVTVGDEQVPELVGEYNVALHYSVGDTVTLPKITATDNVTPSPDTFYIVITPSGDWVVLGERTYTFEKAGVYFIRLCAMDAAMNVAYREFTVQVSK